MEVHKHPHHVTHKKKWGEYLLEFLMLFLAVFLGFLVENFREHQVEHQKEKEYRVAFYQDLKTDTLNLSNLIKRKTEDVLRITLVQFLKTDHQSDSDTLSARHPKVPRNAKKVSLFPILAPRGSNCAI